MRTVVSVEKYTTRVSKQHYWTEVVGNSGLNYLVLRFYKLFVLTIMHAYNFNSFSIRLF